MQKNIIPYAGETRTFLVDQSDRLDFVSHRQIKAVDLID